MRSAAIAPRDTAARVRSGVLAALCALLCGMLLPGAAAGDELGRLFFTPERRAALERARQSNMQEQPQVAEDNMLSVNGVVGRSSGKRTVWINGIPINENSVSGIRVLGTSPPGSVQLTPGDRPATRLPIGTTLDRSTGERSDPLNGGLIRVQPTGPKAK